MIEATKASHTPGPWRFVEHPIGREYRPRGGAYSALITESGAEVIRPIRGWPDSPWLAIRDEDAALIAAAPRMYEALERLHDAVDDMNAAGLGDAGKVQCLLCGADTYNGREGIAHDDDCPIVVARAAIAKARR